jgi:hypothetical protein
MRTAKRLMNFRLTDEEAALLAAYCERTGRTQTDVLRELIRQLARKMPARAAPEPAAKRAPAKAVAAKRPARRRA